MSVLVTAKITGDTAAFRNAVATREAELKETSERGKSAGAIHHRFGVGDGFVLVVDEWESAEQFEKFFSDPELMAFIGSMGADPNVAPEITVTEAMSTADEF